MSEGNYYCFFISILLHTCAQFPQKLVFLWAKKMETIQWRKLFKRGIVLTFTHCFICTVTEIRILVMRGCFEVTRVENESFASLERPLGLERLAMFIFHPSDLKITSNTRIHFRHSTNETMSEGKYYYLPLFCFFPVDTTLPTCLSIGKILT